MPKGFLSPGVQLLIDYPLKQGLKPRLLWVLQSQYLASY